MPAHSHHHSHAGTRRAIQWSLWATVAFVVVQFAAGLKAQSLALISDAGHNLTDALALGLCWFGFYVGTKPADALRTWGYHRAGVLAALLNAGSLLLLAAYIFWESYRRFLAPQPVAEGIMLVTAIAGLALNIGVMWALERDRAHDLNIRGAWAHMFGDALGSVGIIAGAIAIHYTGWYWIDPLLSVVIAVLIIFTAWDVFREALNILLEGMPRGVSLKAVEAAIREVEGVLGVHDLHVWSLGSNAHALSCHVLIEDMPPSRSQIILERVNGELEQQFAIRHTTIQFEHVHCVVSEEGCRMGTVRHRH